MTTIKPAKNNISNTPNRVFVTIMLDLSKGYDPDDVIDELTIDDHPAIEYFEITDTEIHPLSDRVD